MTVAKPLSVPRSSTFPLDGDNWESVAARELPSVPVEEAVSQLQSWNLHVFMRRVAGKDSHEKLSAILPSDVIFLEPPLVEQAQEQSAGA
tara:strand:+ start:4212 stop:4481 length:270 start_codon:yes stop_codon:yes gene_type:complete